MAQAHFFFGEYLCQLDEKSRTVLPQRLRDAISADTLRDGFMITMGFDGCLLMQLRETWRDATTKVEGRSFTDMDNCVFMRFYVSLAREVSVDKVGRLTLPDLLREAAGIDREVLFNGMGDHIEIWSPERWKAWQKENLSRYAEVAQKVLSSPVQAAPVAASSGGGLPSTGRGGSV
jgi:MraZ protein